jgi:hypothetical protein
MTETLSNQLIVNNVRLARVSLTKPYVGKNAAVDPKTGKVKEKYHIDAILGRDHSQFQAVQDIILRVATAAWKDQTAQTLEMIKGNNQRFCLQKGDLYRAGKPEYAGKVYISAGNEEQPTIVVTRDGINIANRGTPVVLTPSDPCWPYAGCFGNVHLQFYTYNFNGSPGLGCGVLGVQFYSHGERLKGSSVSSAGEFGLVPADADSKAPGSSATGTGGLI